MRPFEGEHDGSSSIPCARAGVKPDFGSGRAIFENRPASFRGEATVRSDLHRGRALLREILKEAYDFDEIR